MSEFKSGDKVNVTLESELVAFVGVVVDVSVDPKTGHEFATVRTGEDALGPKDFRFHVKYVAKA